MKQYPRSMNRRERALALEWTSKGMYAAYEETLPVPASPEIQQDAAQSWQRKQALATSCTP